MPTRQSLIRRDAIMRNALAEIARLALIVNPTAAIHGRIKSLASALAKMHAKQLTLEQVADFIGVRVIVSDCAECYHLADRLRGRFPCNDSQFDDYIRSPKPNGYRSLHVSVLASGGQPVEVQIRTQAMHELAEHGAAAHGRYKAAALEWTKPRPR